MPQVVYLEPDDEIADIVDRVRRCDAQSVAVVVSERSAVLSTPLALRLLSQMSAGAGKNTAVISASPRVQELARNAGLETFASVQSFERGAEAVAPSPSVSPATGAGGVAVAPAPTPVRARASVISPPPDLTPPVAPRPATSILDAMPRPPGRERRRPAYFIAIAVAVVGVLLFLFVAPSARVTVTVQATAVSVDATIQGGTDPTAASQPDHILTSVIGSDKSQTFTANPTGKKTLPGVAASGYLVFRSRIQLPNNNGFQVTIPRNEEFDTNDNPPLKFYATADTVVVVPPPSSDSGYGDASNPIPVQDGTGEAKGNLGANHGFVWPRNPCNPNASPPPPNPCAPDDLKVFNPSSMSGGTDPHDVVSASSSDVSAWSQQADSLRASLKQQVESELNSRASGRLFAQEPGGGGKTESCDVAPTLPKPDDQYQPTPITVSCHGRATTYSMDDVRKVVTADLSAQLPRDEELAPGRTDVPTPTVTQASSDDGTVVLSSHATAYGRPIFDLDGLRPQLSGKSPDDARKLVEHTVGAQVSGVNISQSPFPFPWLPFFSSRIGLEEVLVSRTTT